MFHFEKLSYLYFLLDTHKDDIHKHIQIIYKEGYLDYFQFLLKQFTEEYIHVIGKAFQMNF